MFPNRSLRTQRAPVNNPVSLPVAATRVYLLALREAMRAALTDKQSYDAAVMSGPDFSSLFFPLLPAFQDVSVSCHSFLPPAVGPVDTEIRHSSHGGCVGGHYYS